MLQRILTLIGCRHLTLGELTRKAEDGTITVPEFWLYVDMLTAAAKVAKQ